MAKQIRIGGVPIGRIKDFDAIHVLNNIIESSQYLKRLAKEEYSIVRTIFFKTEAAERARSSGKSTEKYDIELQRLQKKLELTRFEINDFIGHIHTDCDNFERHHKENVAKSSYGRNI